MEVVTEEGERSAADDRGKRGGVGAFERRSKDRERARGDRDDSGRKGIHPVDQVDEVGEGRDPEDGQRVGGPAEVEVADERQPDVLPGHPEGGDRDQRRDDDPDHLHRGIDSFDVVDQPERGDHQRPEQDPEVAAFRLDEDRHRHDDADHDRETADARDR